METHTYSTRKKTFRFWLVWFSNEKKEEVFFRALLWKEKKVGYTFSQKVHTTNGEYIYIKKEKIKQCIKENRNEGKIG